MTRRTHNSAFRARDCFNRFWTAANMTEVSVTNCKQNIDAFAQRDAIKHVPLASRTTVLVAHSRGRFAGLRKLWHLCCGDRSGPSTTTHQQQETIRRRVGRTSGVAYTAITSSLGDTASDIVLPDWRNVSNAPCSKRGGTRCDALANDCIFKRRTRAHGVWASA